MCVLLIFFVLAFHLSKTVHVAMEGLSVLAREVVAPRDDHVCVWAGKNDRPDAVAFSPATPSVRKRGTWYAEPSFGVWSGGGPSSEARLDGAQSPKFRVPTLHPVSACTVAGDDRK